MSQPRDPQLPTVGQTPSEQHVLRGLSELTQTLLRSGMFLLRSEVGRLIASRSDTPDTGVALKWGTLNRVTTRSDLNLALPPIMSEWIGVPLYLIKTDYSGTTTVTVRPSGRAIDGKALPKVNAAATFVATAVGLYTFVTDGQNWYAS
jgi:hypothetical protein